MNPKTDHGSSRTGSVLGAVMVLAVVLSLLILSLFHLGYHGVRETNYEEHNAQAFWLAEAGRQRCISDLFSGGTGTFPETAVSGRQGTFRVVEDPADSARRIAVGTVAVGGRIYQRTIRLELKYLPGTYENAIFSGGRYNPSGMLPTLQLSGTRAGAVDGPVLPVRNMYKAGGNDIVSGNVDVNGSIMMRGQSRVAQVPAPNRFDVRGDVTAVGTIELRDAASIAGSRARSSAGDYSPPDLGRMNYPTNNDYNVAKIFDEAGITSGRLPTTHPLYAELNQIVKNAPDRAAENTSTTGDDFYYNTRSNNPDSQAEPESGFRIFGNFMAVNQVVVLRDWYTRNGVRRAAVYDLADASGPRWEDLADGTPLTVDEILGLRHYAMSVLYDDRIRDAAPRMTGLPEGSGKIFSGLRSWVEIPVPPGL